MGTCFVVISLLISITSKKIAESRYFFIFSIKKLYSKKRLCYNNKAF